MTAVEWAATAVGVLLVGFGLRELFQTLLHPGGVSLVTPVVFRTLWRVSRLLGRKATYLAGPLGFVVTTAVWSALVLVGFALIYWPHLAQGFQLTAGLDPARQTGILDAIWVSGVTLTTLGLGDFAAEETPLRLAQMAEAVIGFTLLTAGISWMLSLYPSLHRSRALALRAGALVDDDGRLVSGDPPSTLASLLHGVADQVAAVRVDLIHFPSTYFFRPHTEELALARPLRRLEEALHRDDVPSEARTAARSALHAIGQLAHTLHAGPFGLGAHDETAGLVRYAEDHE